MRGAYFDCSSGASGDMLLGALVGAGADETHIRAALESLPIDNWMVTFEQVVKAGLAATKARVVIAEDRRRTYGEIVELLQRAALTDGTRSRALATFECLADAESTVHGTTRDETHFHEVGSTDALIDIVGCAAAIESLGLERVTVSTIATGTGTVTTEHGEYPLPAPAAIEILRTRGATLFGRGTKELITPTGAAILATAADEFDTMPKLQMDTVGYGAGDADLDWPNVVRVLIGRESPVQTDTNGALIIEANIDDMSPELFPHAIEQLLAAGAHDAWVTPIVMKKGRPAFTLAALCSQENEAAVIDVFFQETTTLGLRTTPVGKHVLEREWVETSVEGQSVRVKVGRSNGEITTIAPEHDDAARAATDLGIPLRVVYERSIEEARRVLAGSEGS